MFCYQCEQTAGGTGCTRVGVCGKEAGTADLQDLLVHAAKGVAMYSRRARGLGVADKDADVFVLEALFATVTNVDFDPRRLEAMLRRSVAVRERVRAAYEKASRAAGREPERLGGPAAWTPAGDLEGLVGQGRGVALDKTIVKLGDDLGGLYSLVLYGLKGMAAYADHAQILGVEDDEVYAFFHETLDFLSGTTLSSEGLLAKALEVGGMNLKVMELLDRANTSAYGHPEPARVRITPRKGKAILVSGHDLKDLEAVLKQTEGKGINVYTHGEMLPAHGYPGLRKYPHLAGNYGGAWQNQREEFEAFPGAVLMTTNCIQKPKESYKGRIFTTGLVAWPGVRHLGDKDFAPLVEAALGEEGFAEDGEDRGILVGFGHQAVLAAAGRVVEAVRSGRIRHFFLVGGCDGAKPGRNYYTRLAELVPRDCVVLTLACGKFRFNKMDFGEVAGLPRLMDVGQCNDAYSVIKVASALAEAFGTDVNGLPLSLILSWYEQKAVVILLTLLHLGLRNIRLGPSLPAFVTPPVYRVLRESFGLQPVTTPEEDLRACLARS